MDDKIRERIKKLQARMDDPASVDVEKEMCRKQIELLTNISYSEDTREFFVDNNLSSTDEILEGRYSTIRWDKCHMICSFINN